jgi:hypothetical protein
LLQPSNSGLKRFGGGDCTREQQKAILDAIDSVGEVYGTVDEIASFYGKSKDAVNGIIKRRYIGKPRRNIVLYSFSKFRKLVPENWRVGGDKSSG